MPKIALSPAYCECWEHKYLSSAILWGNQITAYTQQVQITSAATNSYAQFAQYAFPSLPSSTTANCVYGVGWTVPSETPEQRVAREERELQRRKKVEVAASRAEELLFMCIGEQRTKQYLEFKYFDVEVNGKVYRIHRGRSMNIDLLENGERKSRFCIHPQDSVPDPDTMLAQFLMLTTDEQRFLHVANESRVDQSLEAIAIPPPYPEPVSDPLAIAEEQAFAAQVELAA